MGWFIAYFVGMLLFYFIAATFIRAKSGQTPDLDLGLGEPIVIILMIWPAVAALAVVAVLLVGANRAANWFGSKMERWFAE